MRQARLVHFEDDNNVRVVTRTLVEGVSSHLFVGEADTLPAAFDVLELIKGGALYANVVLLDGNLTPYDISCADALAIRNRIDELELPLRVIGLSSLALSRFGIALDAELLKPGGIRELPRTIDGLEEPAA